MPIIKNKKAKDNSAIKAKINHTLIEQIESYCHWAGIYDLGYFIEKAANHFLAQDLEWNLHKKQLENSVETIELEIINPTEKV